MRFTEEATKGGETMSSFAFKAKNEMCRVQLSRQCCARAEAYGVLLYCNTFTPSEVRIITENPEFAARLPKPVSYTHLTLPTICSV